MAELIPSAPRPRSVVREARGGGGLGGATKL